MSEARRGILFVISAPSGTGKTTVCRRVVEGDDRIVFSVSHTTRRPRPGEREGVDYHFVDAEEFRRLRDAGAFLEFAEYSGNLYGTCWTSIEEPLASGRDVLLEIETEGARQVRARRPDAQLIFLLPPSLAALEHRLRSRGTDAAEEVDRRLAIALREFQAAACFDWFVVNDQVEQATADVARLIAALREGDRSPARVQRFAAAAVREQIDPSLAGLLPGDPTAESEAG